MDARMLNTIANFIWGIADDCLRDVYVRGKYRDVILPMTVIGCTESLRSRKARQYPSHDKDSRASRYKDDMFALRQPAW